MALTRKSTGQAAVVDQSPIPKSPRRRTTSALLATLAAAAVVLSGLVASSPAIALTGSTRLHDPSAIRVGDCLYAFSTGFEKDPDNPTGAVTEYKSCSRSGYDQWTKVRNVWDSVPSWIPATLGSTPPNFWAPDINYWDGTYYLYYAASLWGQTTSAAMGLLTAKNIEGPWTDAGLVTDIKYPIDPNVVTDRDGTSYVSWGSFGAVYLHELDRATGKLSTTENTLWKLSTGLEGSTIVYNAGYYYLLGSKGSCCSGVNSTYYTVAGRSASITGPYVDAGGTPLSAGGGSKILSGFGTQVAAGGADVFDNAGTLSLAYHYYDATNAGRETLNIRPLSFSGGWPVVGPTLGTISSTAAPVINGRPVVGSRLSATDGTWDVKGVSAAYTWLRDGAPISGALNRTYAPVTADLGHTIAVQVTVSKEGWSGGAATSAGRAILNQPPLRQGLAAAAQLKPAAYTQGSFELFQREVAAISEAARPNGNDKHLRDRLTDAYDLLVSSDTLYLKQPVIRSWVTSNVPGFANSDTPADSGWHAFDGELTTFVSGSKPNGITSVTPDDSSTISVDRVRAYPRGENLDQRLVGQQFQGSNDGGLTWETFATISTAAPATWSTVDLPSRKTFQRVRVVDNVGGWSNIAEIQLLTRSTDTSLIQLLLSDVEKLQPSRYTASSWANVAHATHEAESLTNPSQAQADAASQNLKEAIAGLQASHGRGK